MLGSSTMLSMVAAMFWPKQAENVACWKNFLAVKETSSDASRQRQSTSVHISFSQWHLRVTCTTKKVLDNARPLRGEGANSDR